MSDSGNHVVNIDEAVISGKVGFRGSDYVLLLKPGFIECREFASEHKGFSLTLDKITGCYAGKNTNEFDLTAFVPRSIYDPTLIQEKFSFKCSNIDEVSEWVGTLQSVVTDRNIRAIAAEEKATEEQSRRYETTLTELQSIFPDTDAGVLRSLVANNKGDLQRSLDAVLALTDPNYGNPPPSTTANLPTSTPQDQLLIDEQLALALQDELFLEQIQRNEDFRRTLTPEEQNKDISVADKFQEMSEATKKKFSELYFKFKKATSDEPTSRKERPTDQEMVPMKGKKYENEDAENGNGNKNGKNDEDEEEEEDDNEVPLERPTGLFGSRKDGYQQIPKGKDQDDEKLFGKSSNNDDDGL